MEASPERSLASLFLERPFLEAAFFDAALFVVNRVADVVFDLDLDLEDDTFDEAVFLTVGFFAADGFRDAVFFGAAFFAAVFFEAV